MKKLNISRVANKKFPRLFLASFFVLTVFQAVAVSQAVVTFELGTAPIKLASFNIGDKTFEFGTEFRAEDDWLRHFSVNIQNTFSKDVTYVEVAVTGSRPAEEKGQMVCRYEIRKGSKSAALQRRDSGVLLKANEPTPTLLNIRRTDAEYFQDRDYLDRHGYPQKMPGLRLQMQEIVFSDGTMWSSGNWYKADPDDSSKLVRIDKDGMVIPLTVAVPMQEGNPVRINITRVDSSAGLYHLIDYSLQNVSERKVVTYVVKTGLGGTHTIFGTIEPGRIVASSDREEDVNLRDNRTIVYEIDFILFSDGTSWGPNAGKGSDRVYGFFEGRNAALVLARQLLKELKPEMLFPRLTVEMTKTASDLGQEKDQRGSGYATGYRSTFSDLHRKFEGLGPDGFEKRLAELEAERFNVRGNQK